MSKLPEIEARAAELQGDEATIALRVMEWFDLFAKIREAAGKGVDPALLVEQIKRIDPAMLEGGKVWLTVFLMERFKAEFDYLGKRKQTIEAAASRTCPYTQVQYDAAVAKVGAKQKQIATELRVSNKTVQKYGRPAE